VKERGRRRGDDEDDEELEPGDIQATATVRPDTEVYSQYIRENMQPIQICFGRALVRNPGMSGSIDLEFTVATSGRVGTVRVVRSTFTDVQVNGCITDAIRAIEFPRPAGGREVVVTHTFSYSAIPSSRPPNATPPAPTPPSATPPATPPPPAIPPTAVTPRPQTQSQVVDSYRQHLIQNTGGIRTCYTQALARNPNLSGEIEVRFAVNPTGEVALVEVSRSTLNDPAADRCVSDAIRAVRFPASGDSTVIVTHSFAFAR
jgi:TonB family protein